MEDGNNIITNQKYIKRKKELLWILKKYLMIMKV